MVEPTIRAVPTRALFDAMPTILYLSANPSDKTSLDLGEEARAIREALRGSERRKEFQLELAPAIRAEDVSKRLRQDKPAIVHFACHGELEHGASVPRSAGTRGTPHRRHARPVGGGGRKGRSEKMKSHLLVRSDSGHAVPLPTEALVELFEILEARLAIRCVVLNACFTLAQARMLRRHVDTVIGTDGPIADEAAIAFSRGFYQAIGEGSSVEEAFKLGKNEAAARRLDASMLRLLSRPGTRAREVVFAAQPTPLGDAWMVERLEEVIEDAGARYTRELNVELPIARLFDGLGWTPAFRDRVLSQIRGLRSAFEDVLRSGFRSGSTATATRTALEKGMRRLFDRIDPAAAPGVESIDAAQIDAAAGEAMDHVESCLAELARNHPGPGTGSDPDLQPRIKDEVQYSQFLFRQLGERLYDMRQLARSGELRVAATPALLLVGDAGMGKTHLFCDVAKRRVEAGQPTLILLGGQLANGEPWSQILGHLRLQGTVDQVLADLEMRAKKRGGRALLMIDALNEGAGREIWPNHLSRFLRKLARYPHVGVALSVRSSYEQIVLPEDIPVSSLVRERHYGFAGHEHQATESFFAHYGIRRPTVPLLDPEFRNPLFLKLFCKGLQNQGIDRIPVGFRGVTKIFDFFVESLDRRLWKELDLDEKDRVVRRVVKDLAGAMARQRQPWLPRDQARGIVDARAPGRGFQDSLFARLLSGGLLAEDVMWQQDGASLEIVRFSYERLSDHLIVQHLLDEHLDGAAPSTSFQPGTPLGELLKEPGLRIGWLSAFSLQIPERVGMELVDLVPTAAASLSARRAFVDSLVWRLPTSILASTWQYIERHILGTRLEEALLDALLTLATVPDHPYNAEFLHQLLQPLPMAERDARWSVFLHRQYEGQGALDRLLTWAWSPESKSHLDDEPVRLAATALAWLLTASHRFVRDRATKALVVLLTPRPKILRETLRRFLDVDDLYVQERILAVAYGCAMRTTDLPALADLARQVYQRVFASGEPVPHLLLRDYARGVIEVGVARGVVPENEVPLVHPPYQSAWPSVVPTKGELEARYGTLPDSPSEEDYAHWGLYQSVMGFSDFARYIIGTNDNLFEWSARRLGAAPPASQAGSSPRAERFDLDVAQRWIVQRTFDLGWTQQRFGAFDSALNRYGNDGRSAHKAERIGKKYQWIAYHELLARVADNFEFIGDSFDQTAPKLYDGPWQLSTRDIDPSCVVRSTSSEGRRMVPRCFWAPPAYRPEGRIERDLDWLKSARDIPWLTPLVGVRDLSDGARWLLLETSVSWDELAEGESEQTPNPRTRNTFYTIKSYLVKKSKIEVARDWVRRERHLDSSMPHSSTLSNVFLGEYCWAPAFRYEDRPYFSHEGWTRPHGAPCELLATTDRYHREHGGFDCSIDRGIGILLPASQIVEDLALRWNGQEGCFFAENGALMAYDPSVHSPGPEACLVNRDLFVQYLDEQSLGILWTVVGRKLILGGRDDDGRAERTELSGVVMLRNGRLVAWQPRVELWKGYGHTPVPIQPKRRLPR